MAALPPKPNGEEDKDLNSTFDELYSGGKEKPGSWSAPSFGSYTEQPSWHDEILAICKDTGLESLATETGLIQSGEVTGVRNYNQQRGQIPAMVEQHVPAVDTTFSVLAPARVSAAELVQALLSPATPSTSAANASFTSDATPSSSRRRKRKTDSVTVTPTSPSGRGSGRGKGLRHFSSRVCEKVEQKRVTTYNEVADELVRELQHVPFSEKGPLDQKNIRRRVYDALNVLMAMGIIAKERKEIKWLGLPNAKSPAQLEYEKLEKEKAERGQTLKRKHEQLTETHTQQATYRNLAVRNTKAEQTMPVDPTQRMMLPFLLVKTKLQCVINCEVDETHTEYFLNFTMPFEILDDNTVLASLGLASGVVLPTLEQYATQVLSEAMAQPAPPAAPAPAPAPALAPAAPVQAQALVAPAAAAVAAAPNSLAPAVFAPPLAPLSATIEPRSAKK